VNETVNRVERFAVFELPLKVQGEALNPYKDLRAEVHFMRPNGREWRVEAFWDGGSNFKARISPDTTGLWRYRVDASDPAMHGQSGSFECIPSSRRGGIEIMRGYPMHLQHQDGTPLYFFGETAWVAFGYIPAKNFNRTTFFRYVDRRASQGFNYMHVMLPSNGGDGSTEWNGCGANENGPMFHDYAAEKINPAYFQEADVRLKYMNDKGICVGLMFNWGYGSPNWKTFPDDASRLRFARYLVARYSAFNVALFVSGEWNPWGDESLLSCMDAMGREVAARDPHNRLRGIHPWPTKGYEFYREDWHTFGDYQQNFFGLHHRMLGPRRANKPVINSEYGYHLRDADGDGVPDKDNSHTLEEMRHASWDVAMSGGYLVTGFGSTYYGGWRDPGPFAPEAPKNLDFEDDIQHLRAFFEKLEFWKMEPADHLVSVDKGIAWGLAECGRQYAVYVREAESVRVNLAGILGKATVQCFDPRTGERSSLPDARGGGVVSLNVPDKQDWVFLITPK